MRRTILFDGWIHDVRIAVRQLRRRPGGAAVIVVVLAVGIGVGTAVFAAVDAVLFRPLPFAETDRVVRLWGKPQDSKPTSFWAVSPANWLDWKEGQQAFEAMSVTRAGRSRLLETGPVYVGLLAVESDFFRITGVGAILGRVLLPADDAPDAELVAVLTHRIWSGRFGADPEILGSEITLSGRKTTVVGVLPPEFSYLDLPAWGGPDRDIFRNDPYGGDRTSRWLGGYFWPLGLLAEGVSLAEASAQMDVIATRLANAYPGINEGLGIRVVPYRGDVVRFVRNGVLLLGGAALLLLVVVSGNVSGLLLARTAARRREVAIRASLGASRGRLARDLLLQSAILTTAGTAIGLGLAVPMIPLILRLAPGDIPYLGNAAFDVRIVVGAIVLSAVIWLVASLLPALRAGRVDVNETLKDGEWGGSLGKRWSARILVVSQLVVATALASGAGILTQTFHRLSVVDPGLNPENVHVLQLRLSRSGYADQAGTFSDYDIDFLNEAWKEELVSTPVWRVGAYAAASEFVERGISALESVPGVEEAAFLNYPPFWGARGGWGMRPVNEDGSLVEPDRREGFLLKWVTPNLASTLEMRVLKGRFIEDGDRANSMPVVVVNEAYVERYVAEGLEALGVEFPLLQGPEVGSPPAQVRIVGVVANTIHKNEGPNPVVYVPLTQRAELWQDGQVNFALQTTFLVRVNPSMAPDSQTLRAAILAAEPTLPLEVFTTLEALQGELMEESRFYLALLATFGAVALLLAGIGIFAMLAQLVRHRTREIGIRRALGASQFDVVARVLGDGTRLALVGLGLGLLASYYLAKLLEATIVGVEGWSLMPQIVVAVTLLGTALLASWLPARRASQVDPLAALRTE